MKRPVYHRKIAVAFLLTLNHDFVMEQAVETLIDTPAETSVIAPPHKRNARSSVNGGKTRMQELTPAKKTALGRKAAKARWGKKKNAGMIPLADASTATATRKARPRTRETRVFGIALTAAERRLAKAIEERARAASTWAVLNAEIPSLQRTIAALRNQQSPGTFQQNYDMQLPDGSMMPFQPLAGSAGYDLTQVMTDAPIPFVRPAAAQPQPVPTRPLAASRAGGGAIGVDLANDDEEDKFLNESGVAGGNWH